MSSEEPSNFSNESCDSSREMPVLAEKIAKVSTYAVLILVSLVGNFLVMVIVSTKKEMRTTTNLLILNMAASDFVMTLCGPPKIIVEILLEPRRWLVDGDLGLSLCKLVNFLQDISTATTIQSLVVMSMDRFRAIVYPYRSPLMKTSVCCKVVIPTIWFISCAIHSTYFYVAKTYNFENKTYCGFSWEPAFDHKRAQKAYWLVLVVLLIALPLSIVTTLYSIMIVELRKAQKTAESRSFGSQLRRRENKRAMKRICVILIIFLVSLIPINVGAILWYYVWDWHIPCDVDTSNMFFVMRLVWLSNAPVNPCLYFILYRRYRQGLKALWKRFRQVVSANRPTPTRKPNNQHLAYAEDAV